MTKKLKTAAEAADERLNEDFVVVPRRALTTPADLLGLAMDKGADLDQLKQLMEMQLVWEANEARKAYFKAFAAFKAAPPDIEKDEAVSYGEGKNKTEYDHASLGNVTRIIAAALGEHGLSHNFLDMTQDKDGLSLSVFLKHELGFSEELRMTLPADQSGGKNTIQAFGSTMTYIQRYLILGITGLGTRQKDDDGISADDIEVYISGEQKDELLALIRETNTIEAKFYHTMGVDYIDVIPADRFNTCKQALMNKKQVLARNAQREAEEAEEAEARAEKEALFTGDAQ